MAKLIDDPDHENNARKEHVRAFELYFISLYNMLEYVAGEKSQEDHAHVRRS